MQGPNTSLFELADKEDVKRFYEANQENFYDHNKGFNWCTSNKSDGSS
jgi:hypothetical protein